VQSVSVRGDPNSALRIEFRPLTIDADNSVSTVVAMITFDREFIYLSYIIVLI